MSTNEVDNAVAERFKNIQAKLRQLDGDYIYHGPRSAPENLGWRFRQNLSLSLHQPGGLTWQPPETLPGEILAGKHDDAIEATWHDAASAEHYYRYEKDYGEPEEPESNCPEDGELDDEPT